MYLLAETVNIVVDHVRGALAGKREYFSSDKKILFGRHPDNDVAFDVHLDRNASTRHAELTPEGDHYVLVDVGSANGTYVDGRMVAEAVLNPGESVVVDFGVEGPRARIWLDDGSSNPALSAVSSHYGQYGKHWLVSKWRRCLVFFQKFRKG